MYAAPLMWMFIYAEKLRVKDFVPGVIAGGLKLIT